MSVLSGVGIHEWLAKKGPDVVERLAFITGGAFTPNTRVYLNRVGNPQLEKPFDPAELRQFVAKHITEIG